MGVKHGLIAGAILLSGCGSDADPSAGQASPNASAAAPGSAVNLASAAAPEGATSAASAPLSYTLAGTGLAPGLSFGMGQDEVVKAASAALGAPTQREHNDECGEGPMDFVTFQGLQLAFQDGRLAGWTLGATPPALRTAEGLTIGSPRAALGDAAVEPSTLGPEFEIDEESTLGPEFEVDGVGGILDGQGRAVEALWAGSTCQFR